MRAIIENGMKKTYNGPIKAVIFDMSGTIIDPFCISSALSFVSAFRQNGFNISIREARDPMGLRKDLHIKEILNDFSVRKRWIEEMRRDPTEDDIKNIHTSFEKTQFKILPSYANIIDGVEETVDILKTNYKIKIGITTDLDRKMVDIVLDKNPKFITKCIVSGDELRENIGYRPKPYMLWKNLFNMGINPIQSVVKVDDTVVGIEEGINAGCWTIGVSDWGNYMNINSIGEYEKLNYYQLEEKRKISKKRLLDGGAHYVVDNVKNIPEVILDINSKLEADIHP